jgi:hypothetical protein
MFQWVGGSVDWLVVGLAIAALLIIGVFVLCLRGRNADPNRRSC